MGKSKIRCFFLEETDKVQESLRRYPPSGYGYCPDAKDLPYHNAEKKIGIYEAEKVPPTKTTSMKPFPGDWPTHCSCGYEFQERDMWQQKIRRIYERSDNQELITLDEAPAGAMWYADWMPSNYKGPDGRCLVIKTPAGIWMPDAPDGSGKKWHREGTPPDVTAKPSIGIYGNDGKRWAYHGWLKKGYLEEC